LQVTAGEEAISFDWRQAMPELGLVDQQVLPSRVLALVYQQVLC
jgi:hypothetical protein